MRSLFLKIFLGFWLTVIVVGVAIAASVIYSDKQSRVQLRIAASDLLPAATRTAATEFERAGEPALNQYLANVQQEYPVFTFFFDQDGREIHENPNTTAKIRTAATNAQSDPDLYLAEDIAAQRANGPSGRSYKSYSTQLTLHRGDSVSPIAFPDVVFKVENFIGTEPGQ